MHTFSSARAALIGGLLLLVLPFSASAQVNNVVVNQSQNQAVQWAMSQNPMVYMPQYACNGYYSYSPCVQPTNSGGGRPYPQYSQSYYQPSYSYDYYYPTTYYYPTSYTYPTYMYNYTYPTYTSGYSWDYYYGYDGYGYSYGNGGYYGDPYTGWDSTGHQWAI